MRDNKMIGWMHRARMMRRIGAVLFGSVFYKGALYSSCFLIGGFILFSALRRFVSVGDSAYMVVLRLGLLGLGVSMSALGLERLLDAIVRCTCVRWGGRNKQFIALAFCNLLPCLLGFFVGILFIVIGDIGTLKVP
jgi:hypothetical protein